MRPGRGVRPASRACVGRGVPSARLLQAWQSRLGRRPGEGSEHGRDSLGPPRAMIKDFLDHDRSFDARAHLDCATTMRAGQDVDLDQIALTDLEQLLAGPQGGGQDARSNTRFNRCAHGTETWRAGASVVCDLRWPRRAGVHCSRHQQKSSVADRPFWPMVDFFLGLCGNRWSILVWSRFKD